MKNKIPRATLVIWGIIVAIVIVMATVCIVLILQGNGELMVMIQVIILR